MPFHGVLPQRQWLFGPEPQADIGVNDAHAWRLNPEHRQVYDKLFVAQSQGLKAAPCGVKATDFGLAADAEVFVKPIINLAGMGLEAEKMLAQNVPASPGRFWSECLNGPHTSSDCLVHQGRIFWFAHSRASDDKDQQRPIYWEIGVDLPELEADLSAWVGQYLAAYTGLCNMEMIGGKIIEVHLRGSNGFFDFYGAEFIPAWVRLVDDFQTTELGHIPGGCVLSLFGNGQLPKSIGAKLPPGVLWQLDPDTPGRIAILRCASKALGLEALEQLRAAVGHC